MTNKDIPTSEEAWETLEKRWTSSNIMFTLVPALCIALVDLKKKVEALEREQI